MKPEIKIPACKTCGSRMWIATFSTTYRLDENDKQFKRQPGIAREYRCVCGYKALKEQVPWLDCFVTPEQVV